MIVRVLFVIFLFLLVVFGAAFLSFLLFRYIEDSEYMEDALEKTRRASEEKQRYYGDAE